MNEPSAEAKQAADVLAGNVINRHDKDWASVIIQQAIDSAIAKLREENTTMREQWHEEHEEMADYIAKLREENEVAMPLLKLAADMLREIHIEEHRDGCGGTRACPTWLLSQSIYEALSPPSEA